MKKTLIDLSFNKSAIKADTDTNALLVDGKQVVRVSVNEGLMHFEWSEEWRDWAEFHEDQTIQSLKDRCSKMVVGSGKGKGKQLS